MALATGTLTFDLSDFLGVDFDPAGTSVTLTTNVPDNILVDTAANKTRVGGGRATLNSDGTGSAVVWLPGPDGNPTTWQTYVHIEYKDAASQVRKGVTLGPYTITASADLADLIVEQVVTNAETSDAAVSTLIKGTAGAGPLTRAALNGLYGTYSPNARGGIRNEGVTLDGAQLGTSGADITGFQRNITTSGNFSAMGGPSPGQVFGANNFNALGAVTGLTHYYGSLTEVAITAPAGTSITHVFGATSEASFFGAGAGATVQNIYSHRVMRPARKSGAVAGTAVNAYGLFIEGVTAGTLASSTAFSLFVEGGVSRFMGRVDVNEVTAHGGLLLLNSAYVANAGANLVLDGNTTGNSTGSAFVQLSKADGVFRIQDVANGYVSRFEAGRDGTVRIWDGTALRAVTIGAANSGGVGFRTLTIAN